MLKKSKRTRRTQLVPLVLLAPTAALAQVDTSEWECEYCPFDEGYRSKIDAGATNLLWYLYSNYTMLRNQ